MRTNTSYRKSSNNNLISTSFNTNGSRIALSNSGDVYTDDFLEEYKNIINNDALSEEEKKSALIKLGEIVDPLTDKIDDIFGSNISLNLKNLIYKEPNADLFVDFIKSIRDVDSNIMNSYIKMYEDGKFKSTEDGHIIFNDGVELFYNSKNQAVIKNLDGIPFTIFHNGNKYCYDNNLMCLKYDKDGNLIGIFNKDYTVANYYTSFDTYGASQKDFYNIDIDKGYDMFKKYYPEATKEDFVALKNVLVDKTCGPTALTNSLYEFFMNNPKSFKDKFGFDMYEFKDGEIVSNGLYLNLDITLNLCKDIKLSDLISYEMKNGVPANCHTEFNGITPIDVQNKYTDYLREKGIETETNIYLNYKEGTADFSYDVLLDNYKKAIENGEAVMLGAKGFALYEDKDGDGVYESLLKDNFYSHEMMVTGIDENNQLIVSSWGCDYRLDLTKLINEVGNNIDHDGATFTGIRYKETSLN